MKKTQLFNLTDVATPSLEEKGRVNVVVGGPGFSVRPGESVEVLMRPELRQMIQGYVAEGVLSVDSLPPAYLVRKDRKGIK